MEKKQGRSHKGNTISNKHSGKYGFAINIIGMQMRTSDDDDLHTLKERQKMPSANISHGRKLPGSWPIYSFVNPFVRTLLSKNVTTKNPPSRSNLAKSEISLSISLASKC